jgi:hypothetical protein
MALSKHTTQCSHAARMLLIDRARAVTIASGTNALDPLDSFVPEAFGGHFQTFPLQMLSATRQTE